MTEFDLSQKRPQVLLVGNGLTYNIPWSELIRKIARSQELADKYASNKFTDIPYSLRSLVLGDFQDEMRHEKYYIELQNIEYGHNDLVDAVLKLGLDAILTTNYTHEYEMALKNNYSKLSVSAKRRYVKGKKKNDKFLIETFTQIGERNPEIWHIHGDMRNKSSIVLSHDEYARLVSGIIEFLKKNGHRYEENFDDFRIKSWIDYFLVADIYILGLGFDFSEFDLWWMLNRRLREKSEVGKVIFYEPEQYKSVSKVSMLKDMNVEVKNLDYAFPETQSKDIIADFYRKFYESALKDIGEIVKSKI